MINDQVRHTLGYGRILEIISLRTVSSAGADHVLSLSPADSAQFIADEFERLGEMCSITSGGANFKPPEVPVLTAPVARLTKPGVVLEGEEIVLFGRLFEAAAQVSGYILRREDSLPMLAALAGRLEPHEEIAREISRIFDENNEVRSSASPVLSRLRRDSRNVRGRIEKRLDEISERLIRGGSAGENFTTLRQERYVLAILRSEMHDCPGIIQGESGSGNTLFIEPEQVVSLNNRLREIELDIRREILRILAEVSGTLAAVRGGIVANIEVLAALDSLYARARYAEEFGCHRPGISGDGALVVRRGRHPLLAAREAGEGRRDPVVPLELELTPGERTLLVSGPNAGGKTVLLKTVGLICLMAQSGIFPPVDEGTTLPVFEKVITAIGDEQSIEKDLSTFSGHVWDLKQALENGTPRSLVLLDEVGVGTDPAEGAALASAVLERLTRMGCLTLGTTHFGELKLLYERVEGLVNGSLEFDADRLRPTFRFRKGLPGQSYGLEIARNLGLDSSVLERAEQYMSGSVVNINEYIRRLERQQKRLERELDDAQNKRRDLEARIRRQKELQAELDSRRAEIEEREKTFESRMAGLKRRELLDARREVEEVIRRLESRMASQQQAGEAKKQARRALEERISELGQAAEAQRREEPADAPGTGGGAGARAGSSFALSPGDRVRIESMDLEGEVVSGPDNAGKYTVLAGRVRMSLPCSDLRRTGGPRKEIKKTDVDYSAVREEAGTGGALEKLDLRGLRVDDIELELDRFLTSAVLNGLSQVTVIHGKGTGALRSRVNELLQRDKRVENFRPGGYGEGGIGATVVSLEG